MVRQTKKLICRNFTRSLKDMSVADPAAGWVGWGGKKQEIYAATFGGHLFCDEFLQDQGGGAWSPRPPWIHYCMYRMQVEGDMYIELDKYVYECVHRIV